MRYLITGASGFIGKCIVNELLKFTSNITLVIRRDNNSFNLNQENVKYIFVDDLFIKDINWWLSILEDIDCVIHSAWYAEPTEIFEF